MYSKNKNFFLLNNDKKGTVSIFDWRKNSVVGNIDVGLYNEITCSMLNRMGNALILGASDGSLKIFELDGFTL